MSYIDQHYRDDAGRVYYLSASDHAAADAAALPLLGADWTPITAAEALAITNPPPALDTVRADAIATVVAAAAAARDGWRTPGKDGVYLSKLSEADAWEAAGRPDQPAPGVYPYLSAEVGVTRDTPAELVALWRAMAVAWAVASAKIEKQEMQAKAKLAAATTAEEIAAVLAGLEWPRP